MKSVPVSFIVCFLANFLASGLIANAAVNPLFRTALGSGIRGAEDMGGMGPMSLGFLIQSAVIVALYARLTGMAPGIPRGVMAGGLIALAMVADYLVVVGWSSLPPTPTLVSGLITALGPLLGGLALGALNKNAPA